MGPFYLGAFCFGLVMGFLTYRTVRHKKDSGISDIAAVIAAIGGGAVLALFPAESARFDSYAIGLAVGFFSYLAFALALAGPEKTSTFLGDEE